VLKPDDVFFGESVPAPRVQAAWDMAAEAEVLLVVGSSPDHEQAPVKPVHDDASHRGHEDARQGGGCHEATHERQPRGKCGTLFWAVFLLVADQLALSLDATPPGTYHQRGVSSLQRLFRAHFPQLVARYEAEFAKRLGKCRLERISKAVERFLGCGDYRRGIARIQCTNPDCRLEHFRPFSCSVFHP
jgi:hypothetical protein